MTKITRLQWERTKPLVIQCVERVEEQLRQYPRCSSDNYVSGAWMAIYRVRDELAKIDSEMQTAEHIKTKKKRGDEQ